MTTKAFTTLNAPVDDITWLRKAFVDVQEVLSAKMAANASAIGHPTSLGDVTEDLWIELLKAYLPNRYGVEKAMVIDSHGNRSDQIDIVIFDPQYTPSLLGQKNSRYITAEAVYAVFECKQTVNLENIAYAQGKATSVRRLHRTSIPIPHAGGRYPAKPVFPITAGILALRSDWKGGLGKAFVGSLSIHAAEKLDCGCVLNHGSFDDYDGTLSLVTHDGALMHFLFRLLSKLQSLGTVPAIDWTAYSRIIR